ncbi:hypothetical protein RCL1_005607 [Eukaryota sp. TZLM3-RCL]
MKVLLLLLLASLCLCDKSRLWPTPQKALYGSDRFLLARTFSFNSDKPSTFMSNAFSRYHDLIRDSTLDISSSTTALKTISAVQFHITDYSITLNDSTDESYTLSISSSGIASVTSQTVFGALHALETFSQLIEEDPNGQWIIRDCPLEISDFPRYAYRGLLIDTSRHFLPVSIIKRLIDGLSFAKMNVLHWHLADAQSFSFKSINFPQLSELGAYRPDLVYDHNTIRDVVSYALERGVRVVPELDIPGHAYWRNAMPEILAKCPERFSKNINNYPLDPSNEFTFEVLEKLFTEFAQVFPDYMVHLGGDEVVQSCWKEDPKVAKWMKSKGYTTGNEIYTYFFNRTLPVISKLNKRAVVWHEAVFNNKVLPRDTLVHVWSGDENVEKVVNLGFDIVASTGFYLDKQSPNGVVHYAWMQTFPDFFLKEHTKLLPAHLHSKIKGLVAAQWGEHVDVYNIEEFVWPRTFGVADRAWIKLGENVDVAWETRRAEKLRCRFNGRGIMASALVPGMKNTVEGHCRFADLE